ncbi:MAG: COX15/CtaA family protein [Acidimicrobiia bacterium]
MSVIQTHRTAPPVKLDRAAKYAWFVMAYTVGVVLFGAVVRATGSGAGCGAHWPRCNGEIVPLSPGTETLIEFTHRASSGVGVLLVLGLVVTVFRSRPRGHVARLGALASVVLIFSEALLGAGLVLFEWVGDDASTGRAIAVSSHLVNTFVLLAALALTAWWLSGGAPVRLRRRLPLVWPLAAGAAGLVLLGASGAVAALGDTLFPAESLSQGLREDFSGGSAFLVRLRWIHPVLAVGVAAYLIGLARKIGSSADDVLTERLAGLLLSAVVVQVVAGVVDLFLLAPVWMQLVHLLLADLVWISFVLLSATLLSAQWEGRPVETAAA